jgi:hypothetical protein
MVHIINLLQDCVSFYIHGHFKKRTLQIQIMTIKENFHPRPIFYHLPRATIGNLDDNHLKKPQNFGFTILNTIFLVNSSQLNFTWAITKEKSSFSLSFKELVARQHWLIKIKIKTSKLHNETIKFFTIHIYAPMHWNILTNECFKNV